MKAICILILLCLPSVGLTQTHATDSLQMRNFAYVEFWGQSLFSVNLERLIISPFAVRVGAGLYPVKQRDTVKEREIIPLAGALFTMINYYYPLGASFHLEAGTGVMFFQAKESFAWEEINRGNRWMITSAVGFRYIPNHTGWTYGASVTQFYQTDPLHLKWFGGASVGLAF